jgi:polyhydroxyalkanoate synthesis regulator phasin
MAEASFVQDGVDRVREAVDSIDGEFQRVQKRIQAQRKSFEKRINKQRSEIEKRTRKEVKRLQTEIRKNPVVKRAQTIADDATRQVEQGVERFLGTFQIASKSDVQRIDRKLTQLKRQLKALETRKKAPAATA